MDTYSWFIANLHQMIGHDKTAIVIGMPSGDQDACLLCAYERNPTPEARQRVLDAFAVAEMNSASGGTGT